VVEQTYAEIKTVRPAVAPYRYCPSGVVISVPGGGANSNVDGESGARVWFE
jgi:hypothetical protein